MAQLYAREMCKICDSGRRIQTKILPVLFRFLWHSKSCSNKNNKKKKLSLFCRLNVHPGGPSIDLTVLVTTRCVACSCLLAEEFPTDSAAVGHSWKISAVFTGFPTAQPVTLKMRSSCQSFFFFFLSVLCCFAPQNANLFLSSAMMFPLKIASWSFLQSSDDLVPIFAAVVLALHTHTVYCRPAVGSRPLFDCAAVHISPTTGGQPNSERPGRFFHACVASHQLAHSVGHLLRVRLHRMVPIVPIPLIQWPCASKFLLPLWSCPGFHRYGNLVVHC